jgi:hypothetical protein
MRQLTFIKKGRVEWLEVPEPQLTDSLHALAQTCESVERKTTVK